MLAFFTFLSDQIESIPLVNEGRKKSKSGVKNSVFVSAFFIYIEMKAHIATKHNSRRRRRLPTCFGVNYRVFLLIFTDLQYN